MRVSKRREGEGKEGRRGREEYVEKESRSFIVLPRGFVFLSLSLCFEQKKNGIEKEREREREREEMVELVKLIFLKE